MQTFKLALVSAVVVFSATAGAEKAPDAVMQLAPSLQVSAPVVDAGRAIGAMTIGVNIDELESQ